MSKTKVSERRLRLRADLFPDLGESDFWSRKTSDGYTSIPRVMSILIQVIDVLTKSAPAGTTYFDLWCRSYDEHLIDFRNDQEMSTTAGFSGERSVYTWRKRIEALRELGFIQTVGDSRPTHTVILNPYKALMRVRQKKGTGIPNDLWIAFVARMREFGADDFDKIKQVKPKNS